MTDAPLVIGVAKKNDEPIRFKFADSAKIYKFHAIKIYSFMAPLLGENVTELEEVKELRKWVFAGLSDADREHLESRLNDPKDSLDVAELGETAKSLLEVIGSRPST